MMDEQLSLFPKTSEPEKSCYTCRNFAEFKSPVQFVGYQIDGYCFKSGGRGIPVYIAGAKCKDYKPCKKGTSS